MSKLRQLAAAQAFHRVPETCPVLHGGGTRAFFAFTKWLDERFATKLTDAELEEITARNAECGRDIIYHAIENGTIPLRTALIDEIEARMREGMSQERIERIEAGEDPESTLKPLPAQPPVNLRGLPAAL